MTSEDTARASPGGRGWRGGSVPCGRRSTGWGVRRWGISPHCHHLGEELRPLCFVCKKRALD